MEPEGAYDDDDDEEGCGTSQPLRPGTRRCHARGENGSFPYRALSQRIPPTSAQTPRQGAAATGVAVVAMALVCYTCPELVQSTHRNYIQPTMDMVHDNVVQPVQKVANDLQGRFSSSRSRGGTSQTSTDHKTKKARKVKQPSTSTSPVSIASDADSVMVEEMAFLQRQAAEEEERQQEARRQAAAQAEAAAAAATEAARLEALRRPAGCNIPLAYLVNKRCNRLATDNPLYSAADLVQSMMQ